MKVLQVIGIRNGWGIHNRARYLAGALGPEFESLVHSVHDGEPPGGWQAWDLLHLHSLVLIPPMTRALAAHRAWGFELVSERSLRYIERSNGALGGAAFAVAKNERLAAIIGPKVSCPIFTIPNGIACDLFRSRAVRVGWCGRKDEKAGLDHKGLPLIRQAVDLLNSHWAKIGLCVELVLDPGEYPNRILSHEDMARWYQGLDVFVSASASEGCSNVCLEALASGVPIVITDTGIARDMQRLAEAVIVDRTPGAIADGLSTVLERTVRARRAAFENWDWRFVAAAYRRLYLEILS